MTKKETMQYKRAAKEACTAYGIKVYMKDMILLESGISNGIIDYVLFRDAKTGKEYSCAYGIKYYNVEFDTCWDVMVSDPEATEPEHSAAESQPTADRYLEQVEQADSLDELDTITETAVNDETISTAEYEEIHAAALRKAQGWSPQNTPKELSTTHIISGHPVTFSACTAIAASIGDTERQPALFVHDCTDRDGNGDGVIFGVGTPPETTEEAAALLQESVDTEWDTLKTVEGVSV